MDETVPTVPFWALNLVADVAAIKVSCAAIPAIERELDDLRKVAVPMREHEALLKRTETLWDAYQRVRGILWVLGTVNVAAVAYFGGHIAGILP
jgi:hypothetical protein